jgi:hypothetical protein
MDSDPIIEKDVNQYMIIPVFDWDDTIFPYSGLLRDDLTIATNIAYLDSKYRNYCKKIETLLIELVKYCVNRLKTKIYIITLSTPSWVDDIIEGYFKTFNSHYKQFIEVHYASIYREQWQCPNQRAKLLTLIDIISQLRKDINPTQIFKINLISFGDLQSDRKFVLEIKQHIKNVDIISKSIKLVERPSCEIIIEQLMTIVKGLPNIVLVPHDLDMMLV